MAEGKVAQDETKVYPGRPLSLAESRSRIERLVKGNEPESGLETKQEREVGSVEQPVGKESMVDEKASVLEEPTAAVPQPRTDDVKAPAVSDSTSLSDEEEKKASRVSLKEAIRWLTEWIRRQKRKLMFKKSAD